MARGPNVCGSIVPYATRPVFERSPPKGGWAQAPTVRNRSPLAPAGLSGPYYSLFVWVRTMSLPKHLLYLKDQMCYEIGAIDHVLPIVIPIWYIDHKPFSGHFLIKASLQSTKTMRTPCMCLWNCYGLGTAMTSHCCKRYRCN